MAKFEVKKIIFRGGSIAMKFRGGRSPIVNKKCGFDLLKLIFSKNVIEEKRFRMSFYIEIEVEKFLFSKKNFFCKIFMYI